MPDPVLQIRPEGLAKFFELKGEKLHPASFASGSLIPQIELLEWYLSANAGVVLTFTGAAPIAVGANNQVAQAVPAGEWWAVLDYRVAVVNGAAQTATFAAAWAFPADTGVVSTHVLSEYLVAAANTDFRARMWRNIMLAPPGSQPSVLAAAVTGAPAATPTFSIRRCRLPI